MCGNITKFTTEEKEDLAEEEKQRLLQKEARKNQEPSKPTVTWMDLEFSDD